MIKNISLDDEEWRQIMAVLATAPWNVANPLLMKIGDQLRKDERTFSPAEMKPVVKEKHQ